MRLLTRPGVTASERIARLEAEVEWLRETLRGLSHRQDAEEERARWHTNKHEEMLRVNEAEGSAARWKLITLAVAIAGIASHAIEFLIERFL